MTSPISQAIQIFVLGLILLIGGAAWFLWILNGGSGSLTTVICLAGAVGGVANNFRRLQKLSLPEWERSDPTSRWLMTMQIYVSPLVGALFAFVLYGVFSAGMLQGALFPTFKGGEFTTLVDYGKQMLPAENSDVAKVLVWAFIAGFAERFVPNFIDKIAKEPSQEANNEGAGSTADTPPD